MGILFYFKTDGHSRKRTVLEILHSWWFLKILQLSRGEWSTRISSRPVMCFSQRSQWESSRCMLHFKILRGSRFAHDFPVRGITGTSSKRQRSTLIKPYQWAGVGWRTHHHQSINPRVHIPFGKVQTDHCTLRRSCVVKLVQKCTVKPSWGSGGGTVCEKRRTSSLAHRETHRGCMHVDVCVCGCVSVCMCVL